VRDVHWFCCITTEVMYRRSIFIVCDPLQREFLARETEVFSWTSALKTLQTPSETTVSTNRSICYLETPWPSQSSYLNPIYNLWWVLPTRRQERQPQNEQELFEILHDGWNALPEIALTRLVDSMPHRCTEVTRNKGFPIKY
jgi:hypothetical protein